MTSIKNLFNRSGYARIAVMKLELLLVLAGIAAGCYAIAHRFHVEMANRRVEIGLEFPEVSSLAQFSNMPVLNVVRMLASQDVSALIIPEDTPASLETTGAVRPMMVDVPHGTATRAVVADERTLQRIVRSLRDRSIALTRMKLPISANAIPPGTTLFESADEGYLAAQGYSYLRTLGVGLPPHAVHIAQQAGMLVVGRIGNFPGVTEASARAVLNDLHAQGASLVIFSGQDVLGYRGVTKQVAALLRPNRSGVSPTGLIYGTVEFGKQFGDGSINSVLKGDAIRVHSIQTAEMGDMTEAAMVERFGLAARERNIRFLYVRLLTQAGTDRLQANMHYLQRIAERVSHGPVWEGGSLGFGKAKIFQRVDLPHLIFGIIGLGAAGGVLLLLSTLMPLPPRLRILLLLGLCVVCGLLPLTGDSGRKLIALLAGIVFPSIACLLMMPHPEDNSPALSPMAALGQSLCKLGLAASITAVGIVHVAGMLASRIFMLKVDQFLGIKAQHGLPVLLVCITALAGGAAYSSETLSQFFGRAKHRLQAVLSEPARYGELLLMLTALAVIALILARTGNDAAVGVSPLELKLRAVLDHILPVRPRSKEFLLGHPAFVLALALQARGRKKLALPCFLAGTIGQVSMLNTFCHIHTPLIISAWRGAIGLLIGAAIGAAAFLALEWIAAKIAPGSNAMAAEASTADAEVRRL